MRILHVLAALDNGGVEALLKNYYSYIDHDRYQFDFIVHGFKKGRLEQWFAQFGCKVHHVPPKSLNLVGNLYRIRKIIRSGQYDIIHVHQGVMSAFPLIFAKEANVPVRIVHSHTAVVGKSKPMENWLRRQTICSATHYMACSVQAGRWLFGDQIADEGKMYILPNAIDAEKYAWNESIRFKVREEFMLGNKLVVGMVARFTYEKNHLFTLQIAEQVVKKYPDAVFMLVGDGLLRKQIEFEVDKAGLAKNFFFLGNRDDVDRLMQAMDCLILPSHHEGFGLVLLEAQVSGLECFASARVIPSSVNITGKVHFLPLEKGPAYWADELLKTDLHKRENQVGQVVLSGYDVRQEAKRLEKFYDQCVE